MSRALQAEVAGAFVAIERAKAPTILIGPWARASMEDLVELARRLGAPVLTTPDAKSLIDENSAYAGGVFSFGAPPRARAIAEAADVVIAVGTNLGELATQSGAAFARASIVHVIDDSAEMPLGVAVAYTLLGDITTTLRALLSSVRPKPPAARWFDEARFANGRREARPVEKRGKGIDPGDAMRALGDSLPPRARIACDITSAALHILHDMPLSPERRLWLQMERSCCMGSALSAGLGIRLGSGLPTLVVIGDWGFFMGSSELRTAAALGVRGFVVVVWSNDGGALVRTGVRAQGIDISAETHTWPSSRFDLIAKGCGMRAVTVRTASGLRRVATTAMRAPFPVLVDARIDPDAAPPGASDRYIHLDTSMQTR